MYPINLVQFNVITQDGVFHLPNERNTLKVATAPKEIGGFFPVVIAAQQDNIGIVTCHDGPVAALREIISRPPSARTQKMPISTTTIRIPTRRN